MYSTVSKLLLVALVAAWGGATYAASKAESVTPDAVSKKGGDQTLTADAGKPKKRAASAKGKPGKGVREKHISREATIKGKDATNVEFDSVDIGGQRKTPM